MTETLKDVIPLAWPVAITVIAFYVFILIMSGKIRKASASKDGGISLDIAPIEARANVREEARYYMDRRISEIDDDLKTEVKLRTQEFRKPILAAVAGSGLCTAALRAIASDLRGPMYHAVDENDFKHRLSSENRAGYLSEKLDALQEEYEDLVGEASSDPCAIGTGATITFPTWAEVEPRLSRAVESWADKITVAVADACRRKIIVYQEYRPQFVEAGDERFVKIVDDCISKNAGYIEALLGEKKAAVA
jgi:hypothetical protein